MGSPFQLFKCFRLNFVRLLLLATAKRKFARLALKDAFIIGQHAPFVLEHCLQSGLWTICNNNTKKNTCEGLSLFVCCSRCIERLYRLEERSDLASTANRRRLEEVEDSSKLNYRLPASFSPTESKNVLHFDRVQLQYARDGRNSRKISSSNIYEFFCLGVCLLSRWVVS